MIAIFFDAEESKQLENKFDKNVRGEVDLIVWDISLTFQGSLEPTSKGNLLFPLLLKQKSAYI